MKIQCIPIFVVKHDDHEKARTGFDKMQSIKTIDPEELQWTIPAIYPCKGWTDVKYYFEIRKARTKADRKEGDKGELLHTTPVEKFEYKEGATKYIHWGGIQFRFSHKAMRVWIESDTAKI